MRTLALVAALGVAPAMAEPISGAEAERLLFPIRGQAIAVAQDLSETDQTILRMVIDLSEKQMRQPLYWYASIAYSPDNGLTEAPGPISAANHHGIAAADRAALAACDAARPAGTRPCRIGARVLPPGYEARALELSLGATTAFRGSYRRVRGDKAMAISSSTGQFAIGTGAGAGEAAMVQCNAASRGANDCTIVIRN